MVHSRTPMVFSHAMIGFDVSEQGTPVALDRLPKPLEHLQKDPDPNDYATRLTYSANPTEILLHSTLTVRGTQRLMAEFCVIEFS